MNRNRNLSVLSASEFSWVGKQGAAEVSSLSQFEPQRVWSDSCDLGFVVRSTRTGADVLFLLASEILDSEGSLSGWRFVAEGERGLEIMVVND
jgi:hypothetical protein